MNGEAITERDWWGWLRSTFKVRGWYVRFTAHDPRSIKDGAPAMLALRGEELLVVFTTGEHVGLSALKRKRLAQWRQVKRVRVIVSSPTDTDAVLRLLE